MQVERNPQFRIFVRDIKSGRSKGFTVYENGSNITLEQFFKTLKLLVRKFETEYEKKVRK